MMSWSAGQEGPLLDLAVNWNVGQKSQQCDMMANYSMGQEAGQLCGFLDHQIVVTRCV